MLGFLSPSKPSQAAPPAVAPLLPPPADYDDGAAGGEQEEKGGPLPSGAMMQGGSGNMNVEAELMQQLADAKLRYEGELKCCAFV
jgi:hypothetical protein